MPVDHSLLRGMSFEFLQANYWVPLRREGNVVEVVVDNPKDLVKIEDIQLLLPGYSLRWAVGLRKDIERYLAYIRTQQTLMTQRFDISAAMEVSSSEIQSVTEVNTIIDDTLMQEAMRATGLTIKHAVVEAGLRLLVQVKAQTAVRRLRGKIVWEGSPATIRQQGAGGV
jgi:Arc/MetJ family transcription regulator